MRPSGQLERPAPPATRPDPTAPAVSLEGIWKGFGAMPVLRGLDLEAPRGSTVTVMGGSGSGKTVLLRLVAGLIKPDRGRIRMLGVDTTPLREEALLPLRRRMGFVFQGAALFDSLTAYENVAYPLREHTTLPEGEIADRVHRLLARVGLTDDVDAKLPAELSGGMRKRVGIARALVLEPELVLYDEPTAGLDPTNARLITELVESLKAEGATETAMVVTHDLGFAQAVSDHIAVLIGGRIAQMGPVETVLHSTVPEVQAFLAGEAR
ncbi:MAG TPA: ATP-binding cassette domain-containing protein [Methylomirabilota bacterium]|jgi:phospholipid/cholesterol/gamma-HCH transport system ATP-binding protein